MHAQGAIALLRVRRFLSSVKFKQFLLILDDFVKTGGYPVCSRIKSARQNKIATMGTSLSEVRFRLFVARLLLASMIIVVVALMLLGKESMVRFCLWNSSHHKSFKVLKFKPGKIISAMMCAGKEQ